MGKRNVFTKEEVMLGKQISKATMHVKRFNEHVRKFRILESKIYVQFLPRRSMLLLVLLTFRTV